ncbi:tannase/feruloyl esterase family alpha/beta hydrolase [Solimonas sp. K1W22B-7]|uniref:tannase/feruloyl esterase family alpha/beta hydrolase n=1 Tax=Solimonas sp. K1W22B-7 TaxID=2303331 RepID=UPI000E335BB2|nr:tannase/feruloyl esterase family alpha/beta hydrolase [Solimonas sp. K1W22B-7]AXQ28575.1 tannase/feruloyl esterase family alpha/beta hydrolase [Solimonas sp. K1W22B-7]
MKPGYFWSLVSAGVCAAGAATAATTPLTCEGLAGQRFGAAEILEAKARGGGSEFSMMDLFFGLPFAEVPASCRVSGTVRPTSDSDIRFELWLPAEGWNGRLFASGNGGFAGFIDTISLGLGLRAGYASLSTDTGHRSKDTDGRWALGHPEKIIDYGHRGVHEAAVAAKATIKAYYGEAPKRSYFSSCSNGGRQALMEAQRYPEDYDGILAGAPAFDASGAVSTMAWNQQQLRREPGAMLGKAKLPAIADAVLKSCDAIDGLVDGVVDDPRNCRFDPAVLLCKGKESDDCLTAPQAESLRLIYAGPGGSHLGQPHRGYEPGGELGHNWQDWTTGTWRREPAQYSFSTAFFRYLVYGDPEWDNERFEFQRDRRVMQERLGAILDAVDPDLGRFEARGGKLILYHGWSDGALAPRRTVDYYESVRARMGAARSDGFVRLYMAPGVQHCGGGPGPNAFGQFGPGGGNDPHSNFAAAVEAWVEQGTAPGPVVASKYENDIKGILAPQKTELKRTRPLCPYPQVARWSGKGSAHLASSFSCVAP